MQVLLKVLPERRVAIGQAADIRVLRPIVALMKQAVPLVEVLSLRHGTLWVSTVARCLTAFAGP